MRRTLTLGLCLGATCSVWAAETLTFVPDTNSNSVLKFVAETGEYKGTFGAGFVQGVRGLEQNPVDGMVYVACKFTTGTATTGSVLRFDPYTGAYAGQVGNGFLETPDDIAFGDDGIMYVTDLKAAGSSILKFNPTTGAYAGIIANGFLGTSSAGASICAAPGNIIYVMGANGTAIQKFNGVTGAYMGVIGSGFFTSARGLEDASVGGFETLLGGSAATTGALMKFRTTDASYQGIIASGGFVPFVRGTAMMPNGWVLARGFSSGTEYIARFVPATGEYKGLFAANWNINGLGLATETPARVSGTVSLLDYVGTGVSRPIVFEVYSGSTLLDTQTATLVPNGGAGASYTFTTYARGTNLRVKARGTRWLKKQSGLLTIGASGATGVNFVLFNGDCDGSAEVDAVDIDIVIANFGSIFPGAGPEDSDVDGSGEVDAVDIDIVIANFGQLDD